MSYSKGGTKRRVHRRRRTVRRGGTSLAGVTERISDVFNGIKNKVSLLVTPASAPAVGGKRRRRRRTAKKSVERNGDGVELVVGAGGRRRKRRSGMTKNLARKGKRREGVELEGGNCNSC